MWGGERNRFYFIFEMKLLVIVLQFRDNFAEIVMLLVRNLFLKCELFCIYM